MPPELVPDPPLAVLPVSLPMPPEVLPPELPVLPMVDDPELPVLALPLLSMPEEPVPLEVLPEDPIEDPIPPWVLELPLLDWRSMQFWRACPVRPVHEVLPDDDSVPDALDPVLGPELP